MASARRFYRTVFEVEVLSEEPLGDMDVESVAYAVTHGGCSGLLTRTVTEVVDGPRMAELLADHGSDPALFNLTDSGDDLAT